MFGSIKTVFLFGLVALTYASPVQIEALDKRAKMGDFDCGGTTISESDVREAFHECRRNDDGAVSGYPKYFGNGGGVFSNIPSSTDLREFPIIQGSVYSGGSPGAYRVVTDYKDNRGDFRGVMYHTGATVGGAYTACTKL